MRASSLDHLVGAGKHRCRHFEAERLGRLEVDGKLELARVLHGKIGWLPTLEDAIDIAGRATIQVQIVSSIGNQAAGPRKELVWIDGLKPMLCGERDNEVEVNSGGRIRQHH